MSTEALERHWPWNVEDWLELNAQSPGPRYELLDGGFLVTPPPAWSHQWTGDELRTLLRPALPADLRMATAVGVVLRKDESALIPDLVVARRVATYRAQIPANEAVLVVEIVSPSTQTADRRIKPGEYAAAGIPHFWRIELSAFRDQGSDRLPVLFTYALDGDEYRLTHRVCAGERAIITEPFAVEFDPATLAES